MESTEAKHDESWKDLAESIKDESKRLQAWERAAEIGSAAIKPLSSLMADPDFEVVRATKRGLWRIVRKAGRPGNGDQRRATINELLAVLESDLPVEGRREVLWMLSEIGGEESVARIASFLKNEALRDDARMVLERIPGDASINALQEGLLKAPAQFRPPIAHSLRVRGVGITEYPSQKLVPSNSFILKPK